MVDLDINRVMENPWKNIMMVMNLNLDVTMESAGHIVVRHGPGNLNWMSCKVMVWFGVKMNQRAESFQTSSLCRQMELKIRQNSPIDQTTFHMLREVKQVEK